MKIRPHLLLLWAALASPGCGSSPTAEAPAPSPTEAAAPEAAAPGASAARSAAKPAAAEARVADIVLQPSGEVSVTLKGSEAWVPVSAATTLAEGDTVRTGPGASATLSFPDGSVARLNADTTLTLTHVGTPESPSTSLTLLAGEVWSRVKRALPGASFEVQTETTLAVVRGTAFDVSVTDEGGTTVEVYESAVDVSTVERADGEDPIVSHQTSVQAGQQVEVSPSFMDELRARRAAQPSREPIRLEELRPRDLEAAERGREWIAQCQALPESGPLFSAEERAQMRATLERDAAAVREALPQLAEDVGQGIEESVKEVKEGVKEVKAKLKELPKKR